MKKILTTILAICIIIAIFYTMPKVINYFNSKPSSSNYSQPLSQQVSGVSEQVKNEPDEQIEEIEQKQPTAETVVLTEEQIEQVKEEYKPNPQVKIRIIKTPDSEEPDWVNQAWVGLEIPVIRGNYAQKGGQEVVSNKFRQYDNYVVPVETALAILKEKNPAAEQWWQDNVNVKAIYGIAFDRNVCELLNAD